MEKKLGGGGAERHLNCQKNKKNVRMFPKNYLFFRILNVSRKMLRCLFWKGIVVKSPTKIFASCLLLYKFYNLSNLLFYINNSFKYLRTQNLQKIKKQQSTKFGTWSNFAVVFIFIPCKGHIRALHRFNDAYAPQRSFASAGIDSLLFINRKS